jgi:hypothetical protein
MSLEGQNRVMHDVESGHRSVQISMGTGEGIPTFKEASMLYVQEAVSNPEGYLGRRIAAGSALEMMEEAEGNRART